MDKMRWIRVLCLAAIYFGIYAISFSTYFLYLIKMHLTLYSYTLEYLLLNPRIALRIIYVELTRSPHSLSVIMLCSVILGFMTDLISRILLTKKKQKMELDDPKNRQNHSE